MRWRRICAFILCLNRDMPSESVPARLRVLLVDDSAQVRKSLRSLVGLSRHLEVVGEASGGNEAIQLFRKLKPDVLIMDISMPDLTGLEVLQQVKIDAPSTKVIIFTSHDTDVYGPRCEQLGAIGCFHKTTQIEELLKTLNG